MDPVALSYDGVPAPVLAERLGVPHLALHERVGSTLDVAHRLAEDGAPSGTLVLADTQDAGRGRQGRAWASPPGHGIWLAMIRRAPESGVLALRVGLAVADTLDALGATVTLKWPNDVLLAGAKLAGILCEARSGRDPWVAIGVGLNVTGPPPVPHAAALHQAVPGADRVGVLLGLVPRVLAMSTHAALTAAECAAWAARDALVGCDVMAPVLGRAAGIAPDGALLVMTPDGERRILSGTVTCSSR